MVVHRSSPLLRDKTSLPRTISNFLIALALQLVHAFGESIGACFGLRRAAEDYGDTECDRTRFVRPAERAILLSLQDSSGNPRSECDR
jgi:hypothetical protein